MGDYNHIPAEYNPTHNPVPEDFIPDYGMKTPGGTDNRRMWNEKGVLDREVHEHAQAPEGQSLPSNHDPFRTGIYVTNSVGDFD